MLSIVVIQCVCSSGCIESILKIAPRHYAGFSLKWRNINNQGWVKLHRKILENPDLNSASSFTVFVTLLLLVDRNTGCWAGGRKQLSSLSNLHESTVYRTLRRLEKCKMVTLRANTNYSEICICNWDKYQGDRTLRANNKRTIAEHSYKKGEEEYIYSENEKPNGGLIKALDKTKKLLKKKLNTI